MGAAAWLLVFGFVMFATNVMREPAHQTERADAIVVLTGGKFRIGEGAKLLQAGQAKRMLITGVHPRTGKKVLSKLTGADKAKFDCCVDLGHRARDTVGNADETRSWVAEKGYDSLIVVTANYHMPRSLAELQRAMPSVRLVAHPVFPDTFRSRAWWLHGPALKLLIKEYLKYIPAAARLTMARVVGSNELIPINGGDAPRRAEMQ